MLGVHICARGTLTKCAHHSSDFASCNQNPARSILRCHIHIGFLPSQTPRMAPAVARAVRNGDGSSQSIHTSWSLHEMQRRVSLIDNLFTPHPLLSESTYSHDCGPQDESNGESKRRKKSELQRLRRDEQPESLRILQNDANRLRMQQVRGVETLIAV